MKTSPNEKLGTPNQKGYERYFVVVKQFLDPILPGTIGVMVCCVLFSSSPRSRPRLTHWRHPSVSVPFSHPHRLEVVDRTEFNDSSNLKLLIKEIETLRNLRVAKSSSRNSAKPERCSTSDGQSRATLHQRAELERSLVQRNFEDLKRKKRRRRCSVDEPRLPGRYEPVDRVPKTLKKPIRLSKLRLAIPRTIKSSASTRTKICPPSRQ